MIKQKEMSRVRFICTLVCFLVWWFAPIILLLIFNEQLVGKIISVSIIWLVLAPFLFPQIGDPIIQREIERREAAREDAEREVKRREREQYDREYIRKWEKP